MTMETSARRKVLALLVFLPFVIAAAGAYKFLYKPYADKKQQERVDAGRRKSEAERRKLASATGSPSHYKHRVSLWLDQFSGYSILRSGELAGSLAGEDISLAITDDKADYGKRLKALQDGSADLAAFTVDSFVLACAKAGSFPGTIVLIIDESRGADAIVAYKGAVKSIQDLNHPKAGFVLTRDSPSEFLARVVIADFSLPKLPANWITPGDGAADVLAKFRRASRTEPKAYVMWEPYVSMALADSDAHTLLGSEKLKGYILDVLVARRQFLQDDPQAVAAVVRDYLKAAYAYHLSGMKALVQQDAKAAGENLTEQDAENIASRIQWKNTLENYAHFFLLPRQESGGLEGIEDIIVKITNVLVTTHTIAKDSMAVPINTLYCDKPLKAIQASGFHPAAKIGLVATGTGMGEIRGDQELPALSDAQWGTLVPVGEMRIAKLEFTRGIADLGIQSRRDLRDLAGRLKSMPMYYLVVTGHARAEGDPEANKQLAQNRAAAAAEYLQNDGGIRKNRIRVIAAEPSGQDGDEQSVTFRLVQSSY
jgi:hypothetical protein